MPGPGDHKPAHAIVMSRVRPQRGRRAANCLDVNVDVNIEADRSCLLGKRALHRRRFGRRASMIT